MSSVKFNIVFFLLSSLLLLALKDSVEISQSNKKILVTTYEMMIFEKAESIMNELSRMKRYESSKSISRRKKEVFNNSLFIIKNIDSHVKLKTELFNLRQTRDELKLQLTKLKSRRGIFLILFILVSIIIISLNLIKIKTEELEEIKVYINN